MFFPPMAVKMRTAMNSADSSRESHTFMPSPAIFFTVLRRLLLVALLALPTTVGAQQFNVNDLKLPTEMQGLLPTNADQPGVRVESHISMSGGSSVGLLTVKLTVNKSWKVYSMTQGEGGPLPTSIHLTPSPDYRLLGSFSPDHPPKVEDSEIFQMKVESFKEHVTWSVPIEALSNPSGLVVRGYLDGLACAGQCVPFGEEETSFEATVSSSMADVLKGTRIDGTHADVRVWLSTGPVSPGDSAQVLVSFATDPEWHVYAYDKLPPSMFQKPTLMQATLPAGWSSGQVRSAASIISKKPIMAEDPPIREYSEPATLAFPLHVPADAQPGRYPLSGHVAFQTCANQCDRPTAFQWSGEVEVVASVVQQVPTALSIDSMARYDDVVGLLQAGTADAQTAGASDAGATAGQVSSSVATPPASDFDLSTAEFSPDESASTTGLGKALVAAFVGGFILNFMPCVLPVIGLKIMSFVEQAGSDRRKIFNLNLWYVLGMLAIFWVLAVLAAAPALGLAKNGLGWGEQFNDPRFAISLVCVVFVMALSFLGVWEIPIPGFATGGKATELSSQEGLSGAFFKGSITTLLATPCSAPGLITAYAFAVNSGSPTLPFLIFTVMGLGMGFPYLLIGAFPSLISFLPKPGAWMDTFKQLMGFVLLATVVFLMQNVSFTNLLPTIGLLFGLWFACWWIGRVPMTATWDKRVRAWGVGGVISMVAFVICFGQQGIAGRAEHKLALTIDRAVGERFAGAGTDQTTTLVEHDENKLPWEPFDQGALNKMLQSGETVMVDFTADWCLTCRALEATVLNTSRVREVVRENGVRAVVADWGTKDPEIGALLDRLQGSRQIPFLAIFPAGKPQEVVRFSGPYTVDTLVEALEQAGKSPDVGNNASRVATTESTSTAATFSASSRLP